MIGLLGRWRRPRPKRLPSYAKPVGRGGVVRFSVPNSPDCYFDAVVRDGKMRSVPPESSDDWPQDTSMPNLRRFLLFAGYIPGLFTEMPEARHLLAHYRGLTGDRGWHTHEWGMDFRNPEADPSPFGAIFAARRGYEEERR